MKKIAGVIAAGLIVLSAATVATPVYALKGCPNGSLQSDAQYVTDKATETPTPAESITFDETTGKVPAGTILASKAQCNMHGRELQGSTLLKTIMVIIDAVLGVIGLVAVVMVIMGGITYVTSAGDPGKVKKAKDTILYGIVGLVIALLAFAIINFVMASIIK